MAGMEPIFLRCEYLENPLGLGTPRPRLSWKLTAAQRGAAQSAYRVQVAANSSFAEDSLVWDTSKVSSDQTIHIEYRGAPLQSMQRCFWRVMVWNQDDQSSTWSDTAFWEMGLLSLSDWKAAWVEPEGEVDPLAFKPAPYLRKVISIDRSVASARLYITAQGIYHAYINGQQVGDQVFMPGITNYRKRLQYQVYDVADLLNEKENCLGVILGDGWYRGQINANSNRNTFGTKLALLAQLYVLYEDGTHEWFVTDESWRTATGPIIKSDLKDGEVYDARLEMPGWNRVSFDDRQWQPVFTATHDYHRLIASEGSPIRKMERFHPHEVITTPSGKTVLDFGQNLAGYVRFSVSGPTGHVISLQHSETLDEHGEFSLNYLNGDGSQSGGFIKPVLQRIDYTLKGDPIETYEPFFTVQGFRYVLLENYPGEVKAENFEAIAIYSDMGETGSFTCSNAKLDQLHNNVLWSQKGNFLDIPTDCPTRERAGWTGDAQIFVHAGSLLMNDAAFYAKWIKDVASAQGENGIIQNIVPAPAYEETKGLFKLLEGSAGWGDAAVIIPWTLYEIFGDKRILEEQYESMKAWVEYERKSARRTHWRKWINPFYWFSFNRIKAAKYIWDTKYHWGEWLEPDIPIRQVFTEILKNLVFSQPLIATAYYAYSTRLLAKTAAVLGKSADADQYQKLAEQIKEAYLTEFINSDGSTKVYPTRQASYVRALALELYNKNLRPLLVEKLVELVEIWNDHLGTGFLSTPFLCYALSENGYLEKAYAVLQKETLPSWLYAINKGATTIWEDWDGIDEEGVPHASLNHYSKGAVVSWLYEVAAGIQYDPDVPGYQHFYLQPQPGGGLTHASATYDSIRGTIKSSWQQKEEGTLYEFTIPANTTASVVLPSGSAAAINENSIPLDEVDGVSQVQTAAGVVSFDLVSGDYQFFVVA